MQKTLLFLWILLIGVACQSEQQQAERKKTEKISAAEKSKEANIFITEVASAIYRELELSRLALSRASTIKVQEFAKNTISDYSNNIEALKSLAERKGIKILLAETEKINQQKKQLNSLKGLTFDKAYIEMMINDYETDVKKFTEEVNNGKDIETKAFATGKLSILTHHLDMAKILRDSMNQ